MKFLAAEADHVLSHLRQWMKPVSVSTPDVLQPARVQVQFDPLGVGLIIGTWNYPSERSQMPALRTSKDRSAAARGVLYHGTRIDPRSSLPAVPQSEGIA